MLVRNSSNLYRPIFTYGGGVAIGNNIFSESKNIRRIVWDKGEILHSTNLHRITGTEKGTILFIKGRDLPRDVVEIFKNTGAYDDLRKHCSHVGFCTHLEVEKKDGTRRWSSGLTIGLDKVEEDVVDGQRIVPSDDPIFKKIFGELLPSIETTMLVNLYSPEERWPIFGHFLFQSMLHELGHMVLNALIKSKGKSLTFLSEEAKEFFTLTYERTGLLSLWSCLCRSLHSELLLPKQRQDFEAIRKQLEHESFIPQVTVRMKSFYSTMGPEERRSFILTPSTDFSSLGNFDSLQVVLNF